MLLTCARCERSLFLKVPRKYHTLTQNLVIFGSLVCLYYLYFPGGPSLKLMKPALLMNTAVDNQINKSTTGKSKTITIPTTITTNMSETTLKFKSTCSMAADRRGLHQSVIGYSIYGNFSDSNFYGQYLSLLSETLRTIPIRYPGIYLISSCHPLLNNIPCSVRQQCFKRFWMSSLAVLQTEKFMVESGNSWSGFGFEPQFLY